jgi:hypothetical protein
MVATQPGVAKCLPTTTLSNWLRRDQLSVCCAGWFASTLVPLHDSCHLKIWQRTIDWQQAIWHQKTNPSKNRTCFKSRIRSLRKETDWNIQVHNHTPCSGPSKRTDTQPYSTLRAHFDEKNIHTPFSFLSINLEKQYNAVVRGKDELQCVVCKIERNSLHGVDSP